MRGYFLRVYNDRMQQTQPIIDRHAARVLVIDHRGRVLLFLCKEPGADRAFWITPGGGLKEGETHEQAALRELEEEAGLIGVALSEAVWTRTHTFSWLGQTYRQHERFFLLRIDRHDVNIAGHTDEERQVLTEHRWWSTDEIIAASEANFAPSRLGVCLQTLLCSDLPNEPIDVGS